MTEADATLIAAAVKQVLDEKLEAVLERLEALESMPVPTVAQIRSLVQEELAR
jgi:hypothetical protein